MWAGVIQGRIQNSQKGGHKYVCSEHDNCVRSTRSGVQSMPNFGGSEGMPPQKILKIRPSEIESEGTFNGLLLLLLFQDSMHIAKQFMYIWLSSTKSGGMPLEILKN